MRRTLDPRAVTPTAKWLRSTVLATLGLGLGLIRGGAIAQTLPLPPDLIAFDSPEGETLLVESDAREDFWELSMQFVTQVNQAYCGVASMVMVLNGLELPAPVAPEYEPYRVFTQDNFFDLATTEQVISAETVSRQGMTLDELGGLLRSYGVEVQVYHSGDTTLDEFRRMVVENLEQPDNFVLINYLRSEIGQERGGHISPVAAYHAGSDRFLVLDVARYKYPPVWVEAEDLWDSMNTVDSTSGLTRGFVLVNRSQS